MEALLCIVRSCGKETGRAMTSTGKLEKEFIQSKKLNRYVYKKVMVDEIVWSWREI